MVLLIFFEVVNAEERYHKDQELLRLVKLDNRLAFNEIYNTYWKELFHYAYKILHSKELAEDVVQDVFLRIWKNRATLEVSKLRSYLYAGTRNASISKIREADLSQIQTDVIEGLSIRPLGEEMLDYQDLKKSIDTASEGLPERCKEIFYLSRIKEYSIDEIAKEFNISKRTVENQISIALKHIRPQLTDVSLLLLVVTTSVI